MQRTLDSLQGVVAGLYGVDQLSSNKVNSPDRFSLVA